MAQVLVMDKGVKLDVLHSFADGGEPASYGMSGGQRILLNPGTRAVPVVHMGVNLTFFYADGTPVTEIAHLALVPERMSIGGRIVNPRALATKQIEAHAAAIARGEKPPKVVGKGKKGGVKVTPPAPSRTMEIKGSQILGQRGGTRPARVTDPDLPE